VSAVPRFAPFVAAGYFVAHSSFLREVPFDPFLPYVPSAKKACAAAAEAGELRKSSEGNRAQ
jgi:hypothetical protein